MGRGGAGWGLGPWTCTRGGGGVAAVSTVGLGVGKRKVRAPPAAVPAGRNGALAARIASTFQKPTVAAVPAEHPSATPHSPPPPRVHTSRPSGSLTSRSAPACRRPSRAPRRSAKGCEGARTPAHAAAIAAAPLDLIGLSLPAVGHYPHSFVPPTHSCFVAVPSHRRAEIHTVGRGGSGAGTTLFMAVSRSPLPPPRTRSPVTTRANDLLPGYKSER